MVVGLEKFKDFFKEYEGCYLIIGGTACDIIIESRGFNPRATNDIDIILIIEAITPDFVARFWDFILLGRYGIQQKDTVERNSYRFEEPEEEGFPLQLELFCRIPDSIDLIESSHLTPIPVEEGLSNLSAILLDEEYYNFTKEHSFYDNDIHIANIETLICLKAFAYLDNRKRKENGAEIHNWNIIKHKYDVFRLVFLLQADENFELPDRMKADLQAFADIVKDNLPDAQIFRNNRFGKQNMQSIFERLIQIFNLKA